MTVSTGKYRRTMLVVELGRDVQLLAAVGNALGLMLSIRELAADKMLAAFGRREPRASSIFCRSLMRRAPRPRPVRLRSEWQLSVDVN